MKKQGPHFARELPFWVFATCALMYFSQVAPGLWLNSLTNDEPVEITNGYYSLTQGDVAAPHNYSAFATAFCALPLLALPLKTLPFTGDVFDRAHSFLFVWNLDRLQQLTVAARLGSLLLGLLLGFALFRVSRKEKFFSVLVLFFWAFNPTLLALSGLAKTDMPAVVLFFTAVYLFQKASGENFIYFALAAGFVCALAVASKFSCLVLIPIFIILEISERIKNRKTKNPRQPGKVLFWKWTAGFSAFLAVVFLIYLPGALRSPESPWPFALFLEKIQALIRFDEKPFPVYFLGQSGFQNHWFYFPAAFVLKSPTPYVFLFFGGSLLLALRKVKMPAWQWVPPFGFFFAMLPHLNEGIRFLAPALPFTFLIAAQGGVWLWNRKFQEPLFKFIVPGLLGWQLISVAASFPGHLSYFNDAVKPERKMFFLADSNLDWGQDLKRLAGAGKERLWPRVKLAYLGGVDPAVYGLDWEPWRGMDLKGPQPGGVYVVNASFFQLAPIAYPPTRAIADSWIGQTAPTGKIGDSWYYFEIPGEPRRSSKDPFLVSAPFLQLRGYTAFTPASINAR